MLFIFSKITKIKFPQLIWQLFAAIGKIPCKFHQNDSIRIFFLSWSIGSIFYTSVIGGNYMVSINNLKKNTIDTIDDLNRAIIGGKIIFYSSKIRHSFLQVNFEISQFILIV